MPAVVYLRVSTEEQAESGNGLDAQRHACLAWAAREGAEVRGEFADEGLSGSLPAARRPGLADAIEALRPGDAMVVAKRDRICRGDAVAMAMIEAAVARRGARLASAAGEGTGDDDPSSVLMRRLVDAFAEYELLLIRRRTRAALDAKRRRGERTGQVPYGRKLAGDGVRLDDDPAGLAAVGLVRELKRGGVSNRRIAAELLAAGFVPQNGGAAWSESSVRSILKRFPPDPESERP